MDTTPSPSDTRRRLLAKIVQVLFNNSASPDPALAPTPQDTRWSLLRKWNRLRTGT